MSCSLAPALTALFVSLQVYNEANSPFFEANQEAAAEALAELSEDAAAESNMMYSINGFIFCNLPGLNMTTGER